MVNWKSAEVQDLCQTVYIRMVSFLLGVFYWNFLLTLSAVEIPLVFRRVNLSIIHIPYFIGRYCALVSSIVMTMLLREEYSRACVRLNKAFPLLASLIVVCSSTNIMLRPFALFKRNVYVVSLLMAFTLGHWGLALEATIHSFFIKYGRSTNYADEACSGTIPLGSEPNYSVVIFYIYTLSWDAIILGFTIWGLFRQMPIGSSPLLSTLRNQGLGYLIATTCLNIPALAFSWLNLNSPMNIIFVVPGGMVSVMVSSSAVVSLLRMKYDPPTVDRLNGEMTSKSDEGVGNLLTTHINLQRISFRSRDSSPASAFKYSCSQN